MLKNDQNSYHTEVECAQIVAFHKNGLSHCQISKQLSITTSSIQRAITKFKNEGIYGNRKKSGRPRKTTSADDTSMKHTVAQSPASLCKKIRSHLLLKGTNVSISTVSHQLSKEFGLKSYKPAKKTQLTSQMKKKKLEFAKKYINWNIKDWKKVLFSEKSSLQQFTVRKNHVHQSVGERFNEKYTISTIKHPRHK